MGLRRGLLFLRSSRNAAEGAVQRENDHLWMDTR
jgi:hypothetical protein